MREEVMLHMTSRAMDSASRFTATRTSESICAMNAQEFVDAVRKVVVDATGPSIVGVLRSPPGRQPAVELTELSRWYNGLTDDDRTMVERLLALAVRHSVFGVFEVIDGASKVDPTAASGDHFELRHVHHGGVDVISGPQGDSLHELL
jgi:hypothetical protein